MSSVFEVFPCERINREESHEQETTTERQALLKVEDGDGQSPKVTIIPRDEAEIARQRREHWWDAPNPYENYDDASYAPRRLSSREIDEERWGRFIGTPY